MNDVPLETRRMSTSKLSQKSGWTSTPSRRNSKCKGPVARRRLECLQKWSKDGMPEASRVTGRMRKATQGLGSHMVDFLHQVPSQPVMGSELGCQRGLGSNPSFPTFHC